MKRTLTRMISAVCAAALGSGCMAIGADAKVIEPEIVKTESWTTSYYIDDDKDTLYPYIQCEADIYNDGTIKLYMWNTHEWDGFATVNHTATIINTRPVSQNSMLYTFWKNDIPAGSTHVEYVDALGTINAPSSKEIYNEKSAVITREPLVSPSDDSNPYLKLNLSFYPKEYSCSNVRRIGEQYWMDKCETGYYASRRDSNSNWMYNSNTSLISYPQYNAALAKMNFYSGESSFRKSNSAVTFTPTVDPTGTYNFRLYGHDITITPELLSGSIVAEPKQTEQEQKIKALEEENAALKATISAFDADADSLLTAADAQAVLNYYVAHLAGKTTGKVSDYAEYSKQKG